MQTTKLTWAQAKNLLFCGLASKVKSKYFPDTFYINDEIIWSNGGGGQHSIPYKVPIETQRYIVRTGALFSIIKEEQ